MSGYGGSGCITIARRPPASARTWCRCSAYTSAARGSATAAPRASELSSSGRRRRCARRPGVALSSCARPSRFSTTRPSAASPASPSVRRVPTVQVAAARHRLQVGRIAARFYPAQVVQLPVRRQRAVERLPHDDVRVSLAIGSAFGPSSVSALAGPPGPDPTAARAGHEHRQAIVRPPIAITHPGSPARRPTARTRAPAARVARAPGRRSCPTPSGPPGP